MPVRHAFQSTKTDVSDSTLVRPSNWNADHELEGSLIILNEFNNNVFLGFQQSDPDGSYLAGFVNGMQLVGTNWESQFDGASNGMFGMLHFLGSGGFTSFVLVPSTGGTKQTIAHASLRSSYEKLLLTETGVGFGYDGAEISKSLSGSATWNPGALNEGEEATTNVTVTGAVLGDIAFVSFSIAVPTGAFLSVHITNTDTATVTLLNVGAGAALNLAEGTLKVLVLRVP